MGFESNMKNSAKIQEMNSIAQARKNIYFSDIKLCHFSSRMALFSLMKARNEICSAQFSLVKLTQLARAA